MTEIYDDIDKLVLQFVKDGTDKGRITTLQIIHGCSHTGWKKRDVMKSLHMHEAFGVIARMTNNTQWYVVKK